MDRRERVVVGREKEAHFKREGRNSNVGKWRERDIWGKKGDGIIRCRDKRR